MKKFIVCVITIMAILFTNCQSQSESNKLSDTIQLTYKDVLELRLQILAAQISCGSYNIMDMGGVGYPVSIKINNKNKINFKIEGTLTGQLTKEEQEEIMSEGFMFVQVAINEMIGEYLPQLTFRDSTDINGFWYLKGSYDPCAKWENSKFDWISPLIKIPNNPQK
jgi:hypothetical protein